jgi:hypothetical protein
MTSLEIAVSTIVLLLIYNMLVNMVFILKAHYYQILYIHFLKNKRRDILRKTDQIKRVLDVARVNRKYHHKTENKTQNIDLIDNMAVDQSKEVYLHELTHNLFEDAKKYYIERAMFFCGLDFYKQALFL